MEKFIIKTDKKDSNTIKRKYIQSDKDGINLIYMPNLLDYDTAAKYFRILEKKLKYNSAEESQIKLAGKLIKIPRQQVAYCDKGIFYGFSGLTVRDRSWDINDYDKDKDKDEILICKILQNIKKKVEEFLDNKRKFNYVLINRYKDGDSYIGYHADDERELGNNPCIAGVSLGAERDFLFKPKNFIPEDFKSNEVPISIKLESGSIVIMNPPTNKFWKHSVPKRAAINKPRISLTFRQIG